MTFTEFVIKKHPDPDSIYGKVAEGYWDAIDKLAQQYADEQSLEFAKQVDERYVLNTAMTYWFDPNTKEKFTHEQTLTRYHESQKP